MKLCDDACDPPVHLLRPRVAVVERAEARLDVRDARAVMERAEPAGHRRRRVALDEHPVWVLVAEDPRQSAEHRDGHVRRGLVVAHHVEVVVRPDPEQVEHRIEQLAVLRRDADAHVEAAAALELSDHRSELDRLRAGAEDGENLDHLGGRIEGFAPWGVLPAGGNLSSREEILIDPYESTG